MGYLYTSGITSFWVSTGFCTNGLNFFSLLVIHHNATSESNKLTHEVIFKDGSSALCTLVSSLASTNANSSSNLGAVAPVMGDTLVFEARVCRQQNSLTVS